MGYRQFEKIQDIGKNKTSNDLLHEHGEDRDALQEGNNAKANDGPVVVAQREAFEKALGPQNLAKSERKNNTGMPDKLKAGIENLSGLDLSHVKVHYNSSRPDNIDALAFAQGNEIHLAPGEEKHLPHEAWHVVQQMQGKVKPTQHVNGRPVNDSISLEHEANVFGNKALNYSGTHTVQHPVPMVAQGVPVAQRVKKGKLTLGILATILSLGFAWCSPGFRRYMKDAWEDRQVNPITLTNTGEDEQETLYRRKLERNDFRVTATLNHYVKTFGESFLDDIMRLGEQERWLDGGAGIGGAISDYYKNGGRGRTTAIGYEKPNDESGTLESLEKNEKFEYISGKFFSELDDSNDLHTDLEQFSVITDYNGILSYTKTLSQDLQKYLNNLKVNGKLYTSFYANIDDASPKDEGQNVFDWLSSTEGVTVERQGLTYTITKNKKRTIVQPLRCVEYRFIETSNVPERHYRTS